MLSMFKRIDLHYYITQLTEIGPKYSTIATLLSTIHFCFQTCFIFYIQKSRVFVVVVVVVVVLKGIIIQRDTCRTQTLPFFGMYVFL